MAWFSKKINYEQHPNPKPEDYDTLISTGLERAMAKEHIPLMRNYSVVLGNRGLYSLVKTLKKHGYRIVLIADDE